MEIWKDIEGQKNCYQISNLGRIRSFSKHNKNKDGILKFQIDKGGYYYILLRKDGERKNYKYLIHRLVAQVFILNPENKSDVNHKDGIKSHCYESNLEWNTKKENAIHAFKLGLRKGKKGETHPNHKLKDSDIKTIRNLYKTTDYYTGRKLAEIFNTTSHNINRIVNYRRWNHI
jgi:hypothetical protein